LAGIDFSEDGKGVIERDYVHVFTLRQRYGLVQCQLADAAATFGGVMTAGVVNQGLAHKLGCDREKMRAALQLREFLPNQPKIGLIAAPSLFHPLPLCAFDQFVALTVNYHARRRFLCRAPLINLYSSLTKEYGDRGIV
jgi:hypothetical protein